jgi:hypothetical protein
MFNSILELIYIRPPQFLKCIVCALNGKYSS